MDSRSQLQPPYPASEERMEREGKVSIRVTIGPDGRVKAAEKVSATSDAFFHETERHALRAWRFKPATVDGKPVESRQVLTVLFRLDS
jgi:protein TonB